MAGMERNQRESWVVDVVRAALDDVIDHDVATTAAGAEALLEAVRARAAALRDAPTNEHTPEATRGEVAWREMVWRQAFNAALSAAPADGWEHDRIVQQAAHHADAAVLEWAKRWQR